MPSVLTHPNTKPKSVLKTADIILATANTSRQGITNPNAQRGEAGNRMTQTENKTIKSTRGHGKLEGK